MTQSAKSVLAAACLVGLLALALRADGAVREDREAEEAPPDPVHEVAHDVALRFSGDRVAEFQITRALENRGREPAEATLSVRLPAHGTVTGFRVGVDGQMFEARVRPADAALDRYEELRSPGTGVPRTAALLSWETLGVATVRVFPVFPGEHVLVQYEVTAALAYAGGHLHATYPRARDEEARPRLHASAAWPGATLQQTSDLLPNPDPDAVLDVAVTPPPADLLAARFAELGLERDRRAVRLELEAAPRLGELPVRARVVFVIDGSWSEGDAGVAAQLELVRGYLAHVPDARFELVVFARHARRVFGAFVPAGDVDARLAEAAGAGAFAPHNGSDAVAGLALAADVLAGVSEPARVVLLGDRLLAHRHRASDAVRALARLPRGAVVHVVERRADAGELSEGRSSGDDFDAVVDAHGGQILAISGRSNDRAELAAITLGLVRPIRIDDLSVEADGVFADAPASLDEGEGYRGFELVAARTAKVTLRGRVWGRSLAQELRPDAALAARLPALLFGDELGESVEAGDRARLGLATGLLTSETSFLADESDAEASTIGFDDPAGTMCGYSCTGGTHCNIGCRIGVTPAVIIDEAALSARLAAWVTPGVEVCASARSGAGFRAHIGIEYTGDEIVDVSVEGVTDAATRRCVEDAVWAVRLDGHFVGHGDLAADVEVSSPAP